MASAPRTRYVSRVGSNGTSPGTRLSNLADLLWAFVHPAVYGDGEPAAAMLSAAVEEYGCSGAGLVEAMLAIVRTFVEANPEVGDWGLTELAYMERTAELFDASLTR